MSASDWFIIGLLIGLALDIPLVKILLRPINKRISKLEKLVSDKNE